LRFEAGYRFMQSVTKAERPLHLITTKKNMKFEHYTNQIRQWPQDGRHLLAQYDEDNVVYQAYLAPGTPVPSTAIERVTVASNHARNGWRNVPAGEWHPSLEAEEAAIVSDQFELMIFLVRFPEAQVITHDEESDTDVFDMMTSKQSGSPWSA